MRRILIFSLGYYPRMVGGAEVAVREVTDRLASTDLVFDMIAINAGGEPAEEMVGKVMVHRVLSGPGPISKLLYPFAAAKRARALAKETKFDVVWSIMASYAGYAGRIFKREHPYAKHVLTIQEGDHFERRSGIMKPLFMSIFKSADHIQCISSFLADWSRSMGAECPITVIPNAVDYQRFSEPISVERRLSLRTESGFSPSDMVMVTASRLVHKNAVDDIISALAMLEPEYKLLVLGSGPDEAKLKAQAEATGLAGRVVFKGFVSHTDLPAYLQASDIFVRPSRTEGLGNSFLEAMAAGIPVIATPVGGIPDFLKDGETGLFCDPDDPRSLAQKAIKLARDKESRDYIVKNAKDMVKRKYDWDLIAREMADEAFGTA